jgi:hypothetical protein
MAEPERTKPREPKPGPARRYRFKNGNLASARHADFYYLRSKIAILAQREIHCGEGDKHQKMAPRNKRISDAQRRDLIKDYNISFIQALFPEQWPASIRPTFNRVRLLVDYKYDQWRKDGYSDPTRPWRDETKKRADIVVQSALRCREERNNEATWRAALEAPLFARFKLEVNW